MRSLLRLAIISLVATPIWIAQTAIAAKHAAVPKPIQPGPAVVRAFALKALEQLKGPAQLPFLNLLKSLPPARQVGVTISGGVTKNMSCAGGVCTPTAPKANLNVGDVTRLLTDGTLTIGTTAQAPDIFVNAPFSWVSGNGLTLQAIGSIIVNKAVSDSGPAPLTLSYNANGGGGVLSFGAKGHISFMSTGNALTINGQNYILASTIQTLAQLIARNPAGNFALSASYNAKHDGKYSQSPIPVNFAGNLEGLGNAISHLHIESSGGNANTPLGFIQELQPTAHLGNLTITFATFSHNGGPVYALGGLIGHNLGTVSNAAFSGNVSITSGSQCINIGGLIGVNDGTILYSTSAGSVSETGFGDCAGAGGLVGWNAVTATASIQHSYSTASVNASGIIAAGGLVGAGGQGNPQIYSSAFEDFATGNVIFPNAGGQPSAGGLFGTVEVGEIINSSATGSVTGGDGYAVGGLVGLNFHADVQSGTAQGAVLGGQFCLCGGAIGWADSDGTHAISSNLSYGTVTAGANSVVGGFVGEDDSNGEMSDDGWCTTSSGITDPSQGAGNIANDPGISPFTC